MQAPNQNDEIWKDISGYEGLYQVSNYGRVKSLKRTWNTGIGTRCQEEKILKPQMRVYLTVDLCKNGTIIPNHIHHLVARHFIPNPLNLLEVNHLTGIKTINYSWELEWCTKSMNMEHAIRTGLKTVIKRGDHYAAKLVLDTQTGIFYDCTKDAADAKCLTVGHLRKMLGGFRTNKTSLIYA